MIISIRIRTSLLKKKIQKINAKNEHDIWTNVFMSLTAEVSRSWRPADLHLISDYMQPAYETCSPQSGYNSFLLLVKA
jgi:hypothetical protein